MIAAFLKLIVAVILLACVGAGLELSGSSEIVFLGFCALLAGFVAHRD